GPALKPSAHTQGSSLPIGGGGVEGLMMTPTNHSWKSSPSGKFLLLFKSRMHQVPAGWGCVVCTRTLNVDLLCTFHCLVEREQGAAAGGVSVWPSHRTTLASTSQESMCSVDHAETGISTLWPAVTVTQS